MKGHIRKRGTKSWAIVLDIGPDENGKRRQRWHSVKGTKKEAERELSRLLNDFNTGLYIEPSRMTVSEFMKQWLADADSRVAAKTLERYRSIIDGNLTPAIGHLTLSKLKPLHIQKFYADSLNEGRKDGKGGLSAQTVLHFHRLLHKALDQAVRWQLLARNPADAVQPPRPQRQQMLALDEEQTGTLLHSLSASRLYVPVALAVAT